MLILSLICRRTPFYTVTGVSICMLSSWSLMRNIKIYAEDGCGYCHIDGAIYALCRLPRIGIATLSQHPFNGYARWMTWTTRNTMGCATVTVICSLKLLQRTARIIWRWTISLTFSLKQCRLVSRLSYKLSTSLMISCTMPTLVHNYSLQRSKHLEY